MSGNARYALVTGASGGIGRAVAHRLAADGYHVTASGRDADALAEVVRTAAGLPGTVRSSTGDLRGAAAQDQAVAAASSDDGRLDVLVHAVGTFDWGNVVGADPEVAEQVVEVNVGVVVGLTTRAAGRLSASGSGAVVLVGSLAGLTGFADNAAYVASKHAVTGYARALFADLRETGTKVVLVSPGSVAAGASATAPLPRPEHLLQPVDVADAVAWALATPARCCPTEIVLQSQHDPWRA